MIAGVQKRTNVVDAYYVILYIRIRRALDVWTTYVIPAQ